MKREWRRTPGEATLWRMFWPTLLAVSIGAAAVVGQGAELADPSEFYIVSEYFSDNGALFYYRLIDVRPDGPGSLVRYARIAPFSPYCSRTIVQAAEAKVPNISPAQLVKNNNPCGVSPKALHAALRKYAQTGGVFETISFGISARCGDSSVSLQLPIPEKVNRTLMEKAHPAMARIWDLPSEITDRAFEPNDIFFGRTAEDELALERAGEKLVPDLISGRFDAGLAAAVKGGVGTWHSPNFKSLLESYRGPVSAMEANASFVPRLVNADAYRFDRFVAPKYPVLAMQAQVEGNVELRITLDRATGIVESASAISGHPLLKAPAIAAAEQWRFAPNSADSGSLTVTLDFAPRCP